MLGPISRREVLVSNGALARDFPRPIEPERCESVVENGRRRVVHQAIWRGANDGHLLDETTSKTEVRTHSQAASGKNTEGNRAHGRRNFADHSNHQSSGRE